MNGLGVRRPRPARPLAATTLKPLLDAVRLAGVREADLRTELSFDLELVDDRERWLPSTLVDVAWRAAVRRAGPELPLRVAESIEPGTYGHLTYLLATCATVGETLRRLTKYYGLISEAATWHLDVGPRKILVGVEFRGSVRPACVESFLVAVAWCFIRNNACVASPPREVWLTQPRPEDSLARAHMRTFTAPVAFGRRTSGYVLDRNELATPLRQADPRLAELLQAHADIVLNRPAPASVTQRIRDEIALRGPSQRLRPSDVAADLGMSERSLRRQLRADRTSFRSELEAALGRRAQALLADHSVDAAAATLGYADAVSFRRAFRRWFGIPPRDYLAPVRSEANPRRRST